MNGKFIFCGKGAKVPGTDFGLSFALFKIWLKPTDMAWSGYTTASNQGLLGAAIIETPIVEFTLSDPTYEESFLNLHGVTVEVTISPTIFVKDSGIAIINMKILSNDPSAGFRELTFFSDQCKGFSATIGDIHFTATLLILDSTECDPTNGLSFVPW